MKWRNSRLARSAHDLWWVTGGISWSVRRQVAQQGAANLPDGRFVEDRLVGAVEAVDGDATGDVCDDPSFSFALSNDSQRRCVKKYSGSTISNP